MMSVRRRVLDQRDRGAQAVEFAIIAPIFLLLLTALLYFGFVFLAQISISQAARDGARFAAICSTDSAGTCLGSSDANVKSYTQSHAPGVTVNAANIAVTDCAAAGATTATVTITYTTSVGFLPSFLAANITLHGTSSTPCGG